LDSKKLQGSGKKKNHPPDDTGSSPISRATPPKSNVVKPPVERTSKAGSYGERLAKFTAAARRNILVRSSESAEVVDAILKTVLQRAEDARTVIRSNSYLERAFDSQLADENAQLERSGADEALLASAPEIRRKIVFVHACVEQAAREGRPAREVLAERLPP